MFKVIQTLKNLVVYNIHYSKRSDLHIKLYYFNPFGLVSNFLPIFPFHQFRITGVCRTPLTRVPRQPRQSLKASNLSSLYPVQAAIPLFVESVRTVKTSGILWHCVTAPEVLQNTTRPVWSNGWVYPIRMSVSFVTDVFRPRGKRSRL